MASVVIAGDISGQVTLTVPATAGTNTVTVPAKTGTMMIDGPAFSAYLSANQSISANTWTKVTCQTEEFDTNSNYDNATNFRFTPTVAGYYQVCGSAFMGGQVSATVSIYKNGVAFKRGGQTSSGGGYNLSNIVSALVFLNGSTDYIELYAYQNSGAQTITAQQDITYFQASMVRGA